MMPASAELRARKSVATVVKVKPSENRRFFLVQVSIYQGKPFWVHIVGPLRLAIQQHHTLETHRHVSSNYCF